MLKRVLVTRKLPGTALNFLSKYYQVDIHGGPHPIPSDILSEKIKGYDALICLLNDKIDASVLEAGGNLKIVSCYSAGYDNVDVERATKLGIVVTNTPGILTETTADLTWGLLLSTARRIPESDRFTREGGFTGWDPFLMLGMDIYGKTLGIVGFGRIGKAVAKRALGFNMKILYYSPGQEGDGGHCVQQEEDQLHPVEAPPGQLVAEHRHPAEQLHREDAEEDQ
jgi:glyoxylate reductase